LYYWENQQIAIFPGASDEGIYSGSAVVDVNNTSGFFPNQTNGVVAIYTLNTPLEEVQEIAYSTDGGYTFTKYSGNPVISINSTQFRDPKVIWYAPNKAWVMVVSYAQEFVIGIYTSLDLKNWTHASNFSHHGLLGFQYECPNLVELPMENSTDTMYLLQISINPGAPQGGSITQYFPGTFDGTTFTAVDGAARIEDFAKDNYAGQFFYGIPGNQPQISIGWASNWEYAQNVPTGPIEGWRSCMSLPRQNYLKNVTRSGYDLVSIPYDLSPVLPNPSAPLAKNASLGNGSVLLDYGMIQSNALYFEINVTNIPSANQTGTANFTFFSSETGESVQGGQFFTGDTYFWLNRGMTQGFDNPFFSDKFATNNIYDPLTSAFTVSGVIDRSILEVFCQGGERSATMLFYSEAPLDTMLVKTSGLNAGVSVSVAVWEVASAWATYENATGTVVGNQTMMVRSDRAGHLLY